MDGDKLSAKLRKKTSGRSKRAITAQSLILDGLVLATGIVVSSTVISLLDTVAMGHKNNPIVKVIGAGVLVIGTAVVAGVVLREGEE
jgi:hypothetical protein